MRTGQPKQAVRQVKPFFFAEARNHLGLATEEAEMRAMLAGRLIPVTDLRLG